MGPFLKIEAQGHQDPRNRHNMRDFAMGEKKAHTLNHAAVSDTPLSLWVRNLMEKITRYLASTSINTMALSFV
jgi:hypothetical protein